MPSYARFCYGYVLAGLSMLPIGACTDRAKGDDLEEEIDKICRASCPRAFECGYASEGNTLEKCLETCPETLRTSREECLAGYEVFVCLADVSCSEYAEYTEGIRRPIGTIADAPEFPCQAAVVTQAKECFDTDDP
ncbi:hypothetical protein [Nannocystis pusilla]|uniref:hypothetical protein n=1 Tax=Nannocystis pusilla TaxID=889268 RepID=UPI003BF368B0